VRDEIKQVFSASIAGLIFAFIASLIVSMFCNISFERSANIVALFVITPIMVIVVVTSVIATIFRNMFWRKK
jgi:cytochrome c oxidase subunit IV